MLGITPQWEAVVAHWQGIPGNCKAIQQAFYPLQEVTKRQVDSDAVAYNRELAKLRIEVEHAIRQLKVFRILAERHCNRRRRFGLGFNLMAAIYNCQLVQTSAWIHARGLFNESKFLCTLSE